MLSDSDAGTNSAELVSCMNMDYYIIERSCPVWTLNYYLYILSVIVLVCGTGGPRVELAPIFKLEFSILCGPNLSCIVLRT